MTGPADSDPHITLLLVAAALQLCSSLPLLCGATVPRHRFSAALMVCASLCGITGAGWTLVDASRHALLLDWNLPFGAAEIGIDPLSALFLLPVFIITGCSAIYGIGYWPVDRNPHTIARLAFFLGLLSSSLTLLLMARHAVLFLIAWELMALGSFFTLTTDDRHQEVRDAGLLYLIMTHVGTLALMALFSLLSLANGGFGFPLAGAVSGSHPLAGAIFIAALIGFGVKAGMMPLHVWLPSAHATAPSHISAIMSGVVLKMGIYGLLRTCSFFSHIPLWWGVTLLVLGVVSAIAGVAFALGQHDLKRLLAYHSIENIGIILTGIGVALLGESTGNRTVMILGMAGALLHVVNHALFKGLLFLGAGAVIHACGTRELDLMGGAARRLPLTAGLFLLGSAAICGLPPLNGFVSELLVYLGCFRGATYGDGIPAVVAALAIPALALVGGLAVACFVKVNGIVFLGVPRNREHAGGHEAPWQMLLPMAILAGACAVIGVAPALLSHPLANAIGGWNPAGGGDDLAGLAPLGMLTILNSALAVCIVAGALVSIRRTTGERHATAPTWGCGYLAPTPRMQYTASSFADMLVSYFRGILRPINHRPEVHGIFPAPARHEGHVPETTLERIYLPLLESLYRLTAGLRHLQHGRLHLYILYIFVTLVVLLVVTVSS